MHAALEKSRPCNPNTGMCNERAPCEPSRQTASLAAARGFVMCTGADMSELERELPRAAGFSLRPNLHIVDAGRREPVSVSRPRPECGVVWARRYRARLRVTDTVIATSSQCGP